MSQLEKRLMRQVVRAMTDFEMIGAGDRVMVCLSGGKDSYCLLHLLREVERRAPYPFSLVAVNLDQKQPGFPAEVLPRWLESQGYEYRIVERDTYSVVKRLVPDGKTYCALCSRLRRGILYDTASELGATRMALGHHRNDIIETVLLNLFYSGQLKSMPPRLHSDDGRHVVIRPLAYCSEEDLAELAVEQAFPIIPCDLCGSQENLQRKRMKRLIDELQAENGNVKGNMLNALSNVRATHLLDRGLWERLGLNQPTGDDEGIRALEGGGAVDFVDGDEAFGEGCGAGVGAASPRDAVALGGMRLSRD